MTIQLFSPERNLPDALELILHLSDETKSRIETLEAWSGLIDQIYDIDAQLEFLDYSRSKFWYGQES